MLVVSTSLQLFCLHGGLAKFRARSRRPLMHRLPPLSQHLGCSYPFGISENVLKVLVRFRSTALV